MKGSSPVFRDGAVILLLGSLLEGVALRVAREGNLRDGSVPFFSGYLAMSVIYLAAVFYILNYCQYRKELLGLGLAIAIVLRVSFLFAPPALSDDIYRYRWDGLVQRSGINPYRFPPQAPELAPLRDALFPLINNKHLPTIYPPLMELVFRLVATVSPHVSFLKAVFVLAELVLMGVLARLLVTAGLSPMRLLIYAWSPLVIVEIAGSGHNDVLAIGCLLAAHGAIIHKKDTLSICFVAFSAALKIVTVALAPLFTRAVRARALLALPFVLAICSWPYHDASLESFRGLLAYTLTWRANDSLFHILYVLTGSLDLAKAVAAGLYGGLIAVLLLRRVAPLRAAFLALGGLLLLSPTLHPWYLVWIVPYLCFFPSPAWLLLSSTVVLAYHAPSLAAPGEPWQDLLSFKLLEYVPFFGMGAYAIVRRSR